MNLQVIKTLDGRAEYVLLPIGLYRSLHLEIETALAKSSDAKQSHKGDYVPFALEDYLDNPVALARIKSKLTQEELAQKMGVTQAYISKLENQLRVSSKTLNKVMSVINKKSL